MLAFSELVFDNTLEGAATSHYTSARLNDRLGEADALALHAVTTAVSGSFPTMTCQIETSANGKDWYAAQVFPEINGVGIDDGGSHEGLLDTLTAVLHKNVRIRISLGGTSPSCRLKLYVTGRAFA